MQQPINFNVYPKIDEWKPTDKDDIIFSNTKGFIIAPVSKCFKMEQEDLNLNYFNMSPKKCYNSEETRNHICDYLNYFEKFFDQDKELIVTMSKIKYMIDYVPQYTQDNFIYDVRVYILCQSLINKAMRLVEYNYNFNLTYKNISDVLQYTNEHTKIMLTMSILMKCCAPLITHFSYTHRLGEIDDAIMLVFDMILHLFDVDIYGKLYETAISNVGKNQHRNAPLWAQQDIRGKDVVTHSYTSVANIIINIMPKYAFDKNVVALNYTSIQKSNNNQITDISYEYNFIPLSSSNRDENNISDFDKHESNLIKQNEALYLQMKCNAYETMRKIEEQFGPFDMREVIFYKNELSTNERNHPVNKFQKQLVFNLFYKYFGDTDSLYELNAIDYTKLLIVAKKMLQSSYMVLLPYVIGGKLEKYVYRKTVNKKEMIKIQSSPYYELLYKRYRNEKAIKQILSMMATIISSNWRIIDYHDKSLHGKAIDILPDFIIEEIMAYSLLI